MRHFLLLILLLITWPAHADPIPLEHRFGTTMIETKSSSQKPLRIVSVGYHEQDFLYALGLAPVGVHEWFGQRPYATWIWAEETRKALKAEPDVQRGFEIDLEWVWSLKPDLIIATFAPMNETTYKRLSQIAPVIGPPKGYPEWGAPWQEELRLIARATDQSDKAEQMIQQVEQRIELARNIYPALHGKSAAAIHISGTKLVGYAPHDGANRFLAALGLVIPKDYEKLASSAGNFTVGLERIDLFDKDVALWLSHRDGRDLIEALPAYHSTGLAKEQRSVWADENEMGAMSFQSPLSILWAIDKLAPKLAKAVK